MRRVLRACLSVGVMAALTWGCGPTSAGATARSSAEAEVAAVSSTAASSPAAADETPAPSAAPIASVEPTAPGSVYGSQSPGAEMKPNTWTKTDTGRQGRGYEETVTVTASDPRANGVAHVWVNYDYYETGPGTEVATMWGRQRLDVDGGGTWEGPCSGSIWEYSHFTWMCWLSGTRQFDGMTFFYNLEHGPDATEMVVRGHIFPGSAPATAP